MKRYILRVIFLLIFVSNNPILGEQDSTYHRGSFFKIKCFFETFTNFDSCLDASKSYLIFLKKKRKYNNIP